MFRLPALGFRWDFLFDGPVELLMVILKYAELYLYGAHLAIALNRYAALALTSNHSLVIIPIANTECVFA